MQLPEHLTTENTVDVGLFVRVYIDGKEVNDCLEVHTGEGWAIVCDKDENGRIYVVDGEVATKRVTGNVTVGLF